MSPLHLFRPVRSRCRPHQPRSRPDSNARGAAAITSSSSTRGPCVTARFCVVASAATARPSAHDTRTHTLVVAKPPGPANEQAFSVPPAQPGMPTSTRPAAARSPSRPPSSPPRPAPRSASGSSSATHHSPGGTTPSAPRRTSESSSEACGCRAASPVPIDDGYIWRSA